MRHLELDLINYGNGNAYDRSLFEPIENRNFVKPKGGLWASPINSSFGWKEWGTSKNFGVFSTSFRIKFRGKALIIDSVEDLDKMEWERTDIRHLIFPDYAKMLKSGIDGIFLTERGEQVTRFSFPLSLYGWDCESILIMNPDAIVEV